MDDRVSEASDREQRLDEIVTAFLKAQEVGQTPDRQTLLDSNPDLAAELREFFADQERLEKLAAPLRPLAVSSVPDVSATPLPNKRVGEKARPLPPPPRSFGDYTVVGALGQGGMGVVWKARQKRPDRLVALKMFRAGDLASPTDAQRFRNEAEVIAQLDHPHILPVYEVGEHDGVHYFSMKLVEGGSLNDHLDSFRADPRAAARLLATIARAIRYAHQRGVLHRDLKPSNILLDAQGEPHISDFGLAKRVEIDSSLTQSGTLMGTPSYMAPEQTSGRKGAVTTATDVYGLGAVLYALLTGRPPFQGDTVLETLERVREREPEPLRPINPKIDRDLETICLKCLQKEPQRRYESALALAEDLERWMNGKPIRARPLTRLGHLRRWCRRNPLLATLVLVVTVLIVFSLVGLAVGSWLIWQQNQETQAALKHVNTRTKQTRRAVDKMYQLAEQWLADEPRLDKVQRELLEEVLRFYEELVEEKSNDPEIQAETGKAYCRIAAIQAKFGQSRASGAFWKSIPYLKAAVANFPDRPDYRYELIRSWTRCGFYLRTSSGYTEAEHLLTQARDAAAVLTDEFPHVPEYQQALIESKATLGSVYRHTNRLAQAESNLREAVQLQERLSQQAQDSTTLRDKLAMYQTQLGILLTNSGRPLEALPVLRASIEIHVELVKQYPTRTAYRHILAGSYDALGTALWASGENREAESTLRRALELFQQLSTESPKETPFWHGVLLQPDR
jgi:serine/threonine-protein kinase